MKHLQYLLALCISVTVWGCDVAQEFLDIIGAENGPNQLSDQNAFRYIKKNRTEAPETDLQAVFKVMDHEMARANGTEVPLMNDPDVVQLMRETIRARQTIDELQFARDDFFQFASGEDWATNPTAFKQSCGWDLALVSQPLRGDYVIPGVEKIPVRDQGRRGTCAAFTGIGMVEYAALNDANGGNSDLKSIDLSEQKFYYDSKPDCQDGSCSTSEQGSWYGKGMEASVAAADLNIPLEANCPYNNKPVDNDVQAPMRDSCDAGALKLEEMTTWCGIDELIGLLHDGYAVPFASPLSSNWESNDGLITKKDFGADGSTVHAGGHAYLIVGYRELPQMPEEGGICFVVKNSWGKGWGVNGYSCMTLAWMNAVTFDGFLSQSQPVALKVRLREDLAADEIPEDEEDDLIDTNEDIPPDDDRDIDEDDKGTPDELDLDPDEETAPDPTPPEPPATEWYAHKLLGPGDSYYKVECAASETEVQVRGLMTGERGTSAPLKVKRDGSRLYFNGDEVGRFQNDEMRLCTGEFEALCSVRYRESDGQLYIQFRDDDLRRVKEEEHSSERGEWYEIDFGGQPFGLFVPNADEAGALLFAPKTFVRFGNSAPVRLSLRTGNSAGLFDIRIGGSSVGELSLTNPLNGSALCSGRFKNSCNLLAAEQLHLIPRNSGRRSRAANRR
ncbi:MAG: C1 family peptidase [Bradymonadia bacterium]